MSMNGATAPRKTGRERLNGTATPGKPKPRRLGQNHMDLAPLDDLLGNKGGAGFIQHVAKSSGLERGEGTAARGAVTTHNTRGLALVAATAPK